MSAVTPRWGNDARDRKAAAIAATMSRHCGDQVFRGRWLDAGCGSGGITAGLAPYVEAITGVDPEPWDAWRDLANTHGNLDFKAARFDGQELPVEPASFDVVVCNQVYEHVSDPRQLLRNINQALRLGGRCYFGGPNLLWPIEPHVFWPFVHWLPRRVALRLMNLLGSRRTDEFDAFSCTSWTLVRWFKEAGFSVSNAFSDRLQVEVETRSVDLGCMVGRRAPRFLWDFLLPVVPGFVFVLTKKA